jgi:hypothetical protein
MRTFYSVAIRVIVVAWFSLAGRVGSVVDIVYIDTGLAEDDDDSN